MKWTYCLWLGGWLAYSAVRLGKEPYRSPWLWLPIFLMVWPLMVIQDADDLRRLAQVQRKRAARSSRTDQPGT